MAAVTICSDFGAPKNKVSHCFLKKKKEKRYYHNCKLKLTEITFCTFQTVKKQNITTHFADKVMEINKVLLGV